MPGGRAAEPACAVPTMSFVPVDADSHFPLQNLPYGVFSTEEEVRANRVPGHAVD